MTISASLQERYRSEISELEAAAAEYVSGYLDEMRRIEPNASVSSLREAAKSAISDSSNIFGEQAAEIAQGFFDQIVEAEGITAISDSFGDVIDSNLMDQKVRYFAQKLVDGNYFDFQKDVTDLTRFYVKRTAYENVIRNCSANDIRYARIPSGRETCSFCFMLSSRGFVYHSENTARGKSAHGIHQHCDCIIVPGVPGKTKIAGYDPDELYKRWKQCAETVGLNPKDRTTINTKRIRAEVDTRDWKWLYSGKKPKITQDRKAEPLPKETQVADWLAELGFNIHFRATRSDEGKRTSDILIDETPWEIKQPQGKGKRNISNQFNEAQGQSDRLVLDVSKSPWKLSSIEDEAQRQLALRDDFNEVLIIKKDYLRRLKK